MPNPKPNETVLSITIPTEAKNALEALAKLEEMPSVSALVRQLLENYARHNGYDVSFGVGAWGGVRTNQAITSPEQPHAAHIENGQLHVTLTDGRQISTPLNWYPWLANADATAQQAIELHPDAIWWPQLDEGLSVAGMLKGQPIQNLTPQP